MILLDDWQRKFLSCTGNRLVVTGRQVGKSTVTAMGACEFAVSHPNTTTLIISATERQAYFLFSKVIGYMIDHHKSKVMQGKDRPTKTEMKLKNGSVILCLPTGLDGHGIRGLTVHLLIADEAAFINDEVFYSSVAPMLTTTGGEMWLLSTPHGAGGFFYESSKAPNFTTFHVSTPEVLGSRPICETWTEKQREMSLAFIEDRRQNMSRLQFAQEYLGEFVHDLRQVFADDLIRRCMRAEKGQPAVDGASYYLGCDVARMGDDQSTFEVVEKRKSGRFIHRYHDVMTRVLTTEVARHIFALNERWKFNQIFVDAHGLGAGVFDMLLSDDATRRKTIALDMASRPLDPKNERQKRITKEDIYNNLLMLMERDKIDLLKEPDVFESLKSVQFEIDGDKTRYFGSFTHIADGLVRAAWCSTDRKQDIWVMFG